MKLRLVIPIVLLFLATPTGAVVAGEQITAGNFSFYKNIAWQLGRLYFVAMSHCPYAGKALDLQVAFYNLLQQNQYVNQCSKCRLALLMRFNDGFDSVSRYIRTQHNLPPDLRSCPVVGKNIDALIKRLSQ